MQAYLEGTRSPWYSLLFILPLWLLYEGLTAVASVGQSEVVLNGADALLMQALMLFGVHGRLGAETLLAAVAVVAVWRFDAVHRKAKLKPAWLLGMLVESTVYACFFGGAVVWLMHLVLRLDGMSLGQQFMTSLGAGVFEELLFRVLLMGGMLWVGVRWLKMKPLGATVVAVILSSLIFSAFHYIGPLGDKLTLVSFAFRFFAGVLLAVIYRLRGFGIAACTHALYDVMLVLGR